MKDRIAGAPGRYSAVVAGGEYQKLQTGQPFSITLTRDDKPEVEGTPYSKAAVLPDDVAKRLCPDLEDPSPADAFDSLSKGTMPIITANRDTLQEVISSARPGTTIQLMASDEEYPVLTLKGKNAFPENLTILGGVGVTVAGISITSGIKETFWDCDTSEAVLPKGLTLKDLTVSSGISLRNAVVDNLSIINCHITSGSISIAPNLYKDQFGSEESEKESNHRRRANIILPPIKNLIIRDCVIDDAKHETISAAKTAIYVQCVDNAIIEHNTINRAQYNGIQVTSPSNGSTTTGKIAISDNIINYSGSRSIRVSSLRDATLWVVSNKLYNANQLEKNDEYVKVSGCENTTYHWNIITTEENDHHTNNTYDGVVIGVGNGISVAAAKEDCVVAQGTSGIWTYRKWSSGMAECWLKINTTGSPTDEGIPSAFYPDGGFYEVAHTAYPFQFVDVPNVFSNVKIEYEPATPAISLNTTTTLRLDAYSPFWSNAALKIEADVYVFGRYE